MKTQLRRILWYHILVTTLCSNYSPYYIVGALLGCILLNLDVKANLKLPTPKMLLSPTRNTYVGEPARTNEQQTISPFFYQLK